MTDVTLKLSAEDFVKAFVGRQRVAIRTNKKLNCFEFVPRGGSHVLGSTPLFRNPDDLETHRLSHEARLVFSALCISHKTDG